MRLAPAAMYQYASLELVMRRGQEMRAQPRLYVSVAAIAAVFFLATPNEGGKGSRPQAIKIQLRPDPLAR
jgi:hypothetical protein